MLRGRRGHLFFPVLCLITAPHHESPYFLLSRHTHAIHRARAIQPATRVYVGKPSVAPKENDDTADETPLHETLTKGQKGP